MAAAISELVIIVATNTPSGSLFPWPSFPCNSLTAISPTRLLCAPPGNRLQVVSTHNPGDKHVRLPPALLVAYLRNIVLSYVDQPNHMSALIQGVRDASRGLQHDDLSLTLLRMQLWPEVYSRTRHVDLDILLPRLAHVTKFSLQDVRVRLQPHQQIAHHLV